MYRVLESAICCLKPESEAETETKTKITWRLAPAGITTNTLSAQWPQLTGQTLASIMNVYRIKSS